MRAHRIVLIFITVVFILSLGGCQPRSSRKYPREFVVTYAELLVLHEKEKVTGNTPDSVYRVKVRELLAARNENEGEFKKRVEELSRDDQVWRTFLGEATGLMDSIKAVRPM